MRRGEIAINVVVIIALSLLVLAILGVLLTDRLRSVDQQISACQDTYNGTCMAETTCRGFYSGRVVEADCGGRASTIEYETTVVESFPAGGSVCCVTR